MLSSEAFDRWADSYDEDVRQCAEQDDYPFAGYFDALDQLYTLVRSREDTSVLELGFGTAVLMQRLYEKGHRITGVDFSAEMVKHTQAKLPNACLYQYDLTDGLPPELTGKQFDFIVASYVLHHLNDAQKVDFFHLLRQYLMSDGAVLVADVSFESRTALAQCREACEPGWDDEEAYFVVDELRAALPEYDIDTIPMSFCADVLIFTPVE